MQFFDTHAHIGLIYDDPIEQLRVIQEAKQNNAHQKINKKETRSTEKENGKAATVFS